MNRQQLVGLAILLLTFLFASNISKALGSALDSLPIRFLAVLLILGSFTYDKVISVGVFLVVAGIYIHHHHLNVLNITGTINNLASYNNAGTENSEAVSKLDQGGVADESYETSEFTPRQEDQDNEFDYAERSMNEKHVLLTEPLGSRSQNIFPEDIKHATLAEHGNRNGYSD